MMSAEIFHQIGCRIAIVGVFRNEGHEAVGFGAIGIFLKGGARHADGAFKHFHQCFDKFGGAIARHDVVFLHAPAFACQQGVDLHP